MFTFKEMMHDARSTFPAPNAQRPSNKKSTPCRLMCELLKNVCFSGIGAPTLPWFSSKVSKDGRMVSFGQMMAIRSEFVIWHFFNMPLLAERRKWNIILSKILHAIYDHYSFSGYELNSFSLFKDVDHFKESERDYQKLKK